MRLSAGKDFSQPADASMRKSTLTKVIRKNSSGSEEEESKMDEINKSIKMPNEYNPSLYKTLDVDDEVRELFQYIVKWVFLIFFILNSYFQLVFQIYAATIDSGLQIQTFYTRLSASCRRY